MAKPNQNSKAPEQKSASKVPALSVVSSRDGFRRGGRAWSRQETVVKLSELTKQQIAQIKGEPLLTVSEVEVDEEVSAE